MHGKSYRELSAYEKHQIKIAVIKKLKPVWTILISVATSVITTLIYIR